MTTGGDAMPDRKTLPPIEAHPRWSLSKPGHTAKAFARSTPSGPELIIQVGWTLDSP
jgi:hypothetical protein